MKKQIKIPAKAISKEEVLASMQQARAGDLKWQDGKSFCLIYYPGDEKAELIKEAYNMFFTENAVNPMAFPSIKNFEAEVIGMVKELLNGNDHTAGTMTSGGTESILMAVKAARDYAAQEKKIIKPEIIIPVTAHPAFHKACHYFKIKAVVVPVDKNYRVDVSEVENSITSNTIMIIGSAPAYPHGIIDPLDKLSGIALKHDLLFHVDACVGGFFLPFMEKLGYSVPLFDFRLPGVTSISLDLHKFGYSAKGASIVLYRNNDLRRAQFYIYTNWPGGVYGSVAITGTKPGGAIAAAWAALMGIGEDGYLELTSKTLQATHKIKKGIEGIKEIYLMTEPDMSILAFTSDTIDIYEVADELNARGWHFERLQSPPAIHLTVSQIHQNIADTFLADLTESVNKAGTPKVRQLKSKLQIAAVKKLTKILPPGMLAKIQGKLTSKKPLKNEKSAALYGMMGALSGSEDLDVIVLNYLDKLNK